MTKKVKVSAALLFFLLTTIAVSATVPKSEHEKESYALGRNIGESFLNQGIEIEKKAFLNGLNSALNNEKSHFTQEEMFGILRKLEEKARAKKEARDKNLSAENKRIGREFLAKNKKQPGVKELPGGLQYKTLKEGKGKTPQVNSVVKVHYKGTLIDGTEFDSSYSRGTPAEFPVNRVIKGWTEALQKMKVGSVWELYIPSDLAYGDNPPPGVIKPGSTLLFKVELLAIVK